MALLPLASGSEARGFWASTAASSIRRVVRRRSPSSASANSWTAQVVSSTRLLIRRSCVQGVIIGRIQGFHAFSIPQDTRKQKLWVTGSLPGEGVKMQNDLPLTLTLGLCSTREGTEEGPILSSRQPGKLLRPTPGL